ncbi:MAG: hypothetical protein HYZ46_01170 [Nitrosomonadales bacterium]|nr:hypothetical protein [Nitrosomonadales bacterium]
MKKLIAFKMFVASVIGIFLHSATLSAAVLEVTPPISLTLEKGATISHFLEAADGGHIQVVENRNKHEPWVTKMSANFQNQWNAPVSAEHIDFLAKASDGGYWIGVPNKIKVSGSMFPVFQYESLVKISTDGKIQSQTGIVIKEEGLNSIYSAIDVGDGMIFAGWKVVTYYGPGGETYIFKELVPWLGKYDYSGKLLWEKIFAEDNDTLLSINMRPRDNHGHRLVATPAGDVLFVASVHVSDISRQNGKTTVNQTSLDNYSWANFVFKIDSKGNELARIKSSGQSLKPSLFETNSGIVLIESYIPSSFGAHDNPSKGSPFESLAIPIEGIRYTNFDSSFNVVKHKEFPSGFDYSFATEEAGGGYFLTGYQHGQNPSGRVGFISPDGELLEAAPLIKDDEHSRLIGLTSNDNHSHATIFRQNSEGKVFSYQAKITK